jgi:hypothetical protein
MTDQLPATIQPGALTIRTDTHLVPALIAGAGETARSDQHGRGAHLDAASSSSRRVEPQHAARPTAKNGPACQTAARARWGRLAPTGA